MHARQPWIRRLLGGWLIVQLSSLLSAPIVMCSMHAVETGAQCVCPHEDGGACPMHHPAKPSNPCSCRSTTDPMATIAALLVGPAAVATATSVQFNLCPIGSGPILFNATIHDAYLVPVAPPPRT